MALSPAAGRPDPPLPGDYLLAAYLAATGLAALLTGSRTGLLLAGAHAAAIGGVAWSARRPLPAAGWLRFARIAAPVLLTPLLYTELETLNQLVEPGYLDATVQAWDEAVFGEQVSLTAARRFGSPWLSETLHLGYFSYYFVVPAAALAAWAEGRERGLARFTTTVAPAFFLCYLCFAVFPVAGPRYEFPRVTGAPAGGFFFGLVHTVLEAGSSKGTAFPSSHVAAALAALLAAWRDGRKSFPWLLPPVLLLTLGTVYGRFHYGVDAVAGIAVAGIAFAATPWLHRMLGSGGDEDGPGRATLAEVRVSQ